MAEQPIQPPQNPPEEENEHAEIYSVSQDQDGSLHFSRRDFLYFALAVGGTLLVKGVCPRFGASPASTTTQPVQAGMNPLPSVYVHAKPSIDSNIVDTLHPNDIVLLIGDHADLGWVEVATRSDQRGWLNRRFVDFTNAFTRTSQDFGSSSTQTPTVAQTPAPDALLVQTGYYIYLPIIIMDRPTPTPTNTRTPTATHIHTPCGSYGVCVCHSLPSSCTCNSNPCRCNAYPCTCDSFPCICNYT